MLFTSKLRIAAGLFSVIAAYASNAKAAEIIAGQDSLSATWAGIGSSTNSLFNYNLFDSSLGTLNSVSLMIDLNGSGDWFADYTGFEPGLIQVTFTGGQAFNMDGIGNNGWIDPNNGWNPIIDDVKVTDKVVVNTTVPFWIMSGTDGPSFDWAASQTFGLPNLSAFIGTGTNQSNFSSYGLFDVATNPQLNKVAAYGLNYEWNAKYKLVYNYTPVPEPSGALLGGVAFAALGLRRRRTHS